MKKLLYLIVFTFSLLFTSHGLLNAQVNLAQDFRNQMEIPGIVEIASSPAHLYILSESEGLIVFRVHSDSLQWLYTSTGMQRRGNTIDADSRFAYLYGNTRRLTVIEPTSVLGVYSSTVLPERPLATERIGNYLYIAFGENGLGKISLDTPESVDKTPEYVDRGRLDGYPVTALASDNYEMLYVLSGNRFIDLYESDDESDSIVHDQRVELSGQAENIFLVDGELIASNRNGELFKVDSTGRLRIFSDVGSSVLKVTGWQDKLIVRTADHKLWVGDYSSGITAWKENERAGNHYTVVENQFWVSEFNSFAPVIRREATAASGRSSSGITDGIKLASIEDRVLPFPRPLLIPLHVDAPGYDASNISFSYQGSVDNAKIRGQSFYWQPRASQTGQQNFTVTATTSDGHSDTVQFSVTLRPFNSPPRFSPTRPVTIVADTDFELKIDAHDPDGRNPELIRFLGMELPNGASLDEKTGVFKWTPNIRQVGEHKFRVIATDQYGAASSQDYEIRVVELDEDDDIDFSDEINN